MPTISPDDIHISGRPARFEELSSMVRAPEEIDSATIELGMQPWLLNPHLATNIDLSSLGLGPAIHIPVQIASRDGGRKSLYFLSAGEEVLAGVYAVVEGLLFRYMKRVTGTAMPAESGDTYAERLTTRDGATLVEMQGPIEVIDIEAGQGAVRLFADDPAVEEGVKFWFLWSCILLEDK